MYVSFLKYKVRKLGGVGPQWPIGVLGVGVTKGGVSLLNLIFYQNRSKYFERLKSQHYLWAVRQSDFLAFSGFPLFHLAGVVVGGRGRWLRICC